MAPQRPQPAVSRSELSWTTGGLSNAPHAEMQLQHRLDLVRHNAANAATDNMNQDTQLKSVHMTESSNNEKKHAIGCEYLDIMVNRQ